MKALFISNDPLIFDATSSVHARMLSYAAEIGELHILSRAPVGTSETMEGPLFLHPYVGGKVFAQMKMPQLAHDLITRYGIEIVSAQDPFEYGRIAAKAVEGTGAKLHIQIHTDFLSPWFTKGGGFRSMQVRMPALNKVRVTMADDVLLRAKGIRVVSERIRRSLIERYGEKVRAVTVIPVAVSATLPPPVALPPHPFSFALMTIGRLEPEKRIEDILMALGQVKADHPSVGLFIVGEGSERQKLEFLTKKLGLENMVVFTGWRTDSLGLLQSATAYIQASAYEGYGRTLVEAALARIPIITTDVGIVGEVFRGYEDVLSAPVADPTALAVHIRGLVDDHQARQTFVMNAEHAARNHLAAVSDQPRLIAEDLAATLARV